MNLTTQREFRSTDPGAPTLTGEAGSFNALIKTVLVGSGGTAYAGKASAGWSTIYEAGNVLVLAGSSAAGGSGYRFRFDDSGIGAGLTREAMVRAYSSMSDIDTGLHEMPPSAAMSFGGPIRKSATTDGVARQWMVWADEITCYCWIAQSGDSPNFFGWGDYDPAIVSDPYRAFVFSGWRYNNASMSGSNLAGVRGLDTPTYERGTYIGSDSYLLGNPLRVSMPVLAQYTTRNQNVLSNNYSIGGAGSPPGVEGVTVRRFFIPALVAAEGVVRGRMRGLYLPVHNIYSVVIAGDYESVASGLPSGSRLAYANSHTGGTIGEGVFAVETGLGW